MFHPLSYSSSVRSIELGIGLIELGIGLRINNAGAPSWPVYPALLKKNTSSRETNSNHNSNSNDNNNNQNLC